MDALLLSHRHLDRHRRRRQRTQPGFGAARRLLGVALVIAGFSVFVYHKNSQGDHANDVSSFLVSPRGLRHNLAPRPTMCSRMLSNRQGRIPSPKGKLLIPGEDGVDNEGTFNPFMQPLSKEESQKYGKPPQMLKTLRFRAAPWMEAAEMVDILLRLGVSPETINEDGGVTAMEQGNWRVSLEVLRSLESLNCPQEILDFFKGDEDGADVIFGLRMSPKDIRVAAAAYVMERGYNRREAETLSRNIVDFHRYKNGVDAFEYTPANCRALRLYIQAAEAPTDRDRDRLIEEARETGCSEAALKKFEELEKMDYATRRRIIYTFKSDTEKFDDLLTVDAF